MPSETGITSILGVEKTLNKNQPNGYAGLDASGYLSEINNMSLIPIGVKLILVDNWYWYRAPIMDDTIELSNLIFVASDHYIAFDDFLECFNMRKI